MPKVIDCVHFSPTKQQYFDFPTICIFLPMFNWEYNSHCHNLFLYIIVSISPKFVSIGF